MATMNPNVRVFDCGGVLVRFEIDRNGCVDIHLTAEWDIFYLNQLSSRELTKKLFPNGYTDQADPETETAKEVVK